MQNLGVGWTDRKNGNNQLKILIYSELVEQVLDSSNTLAT